MNPCTFTEDQSVVLQVNYPLAPHPDAPMLSAGTTGTVRFVQASGEGYPRVLVAFDNGITTWVRGEALTEGGS